MVIIGLIISLNKSKIYTTLTTLLNNISLYPIVSNECSFNTVILDNTTSLPPKVIQEPSSTRTQINGNLPDFLRRLGQRKLIAIDWFPCDDRQLSSTWFVTYDNLAVLHDYFEAIKHPQLETWMVKTALWGDSCPGWIHWYSGCNIQFKDGASGAACRITAAFCLSLLIVADEMTQDSIVGSFATDINKYEQQRCQKISTKRRWQVARKLRLPEVSTIPGSIMDMSLVIIVVTSSSSSLSAWGIPTTECCWQRVLVRLPNVSTLRCVNPFYPSPIKKGKTNPMLLRIWTFKWSTIKHQTIYSQDCAAWIVLCQCNPHFSAYCPHLSACNAHSIAMPDKDLPLRFVWVGYQSNAKTKRNHDNISQELPAVQAIIYEVASNHNYIDGKVGVC